MNQPTVTAQNVLSGEKSFQSVQFAVTGNPLADLLAGITAVLNLHDIRIIHKALLLEYLAKAYKHDSDVYEKSIQVPPWNPNQFPSIGIGSVPPCAPPLDRPYSVGNAMAAHGATMNEMLNGYKRK